MADSFFGRYATDSSGTLSEGRLYLGIFGSDYGSILTTQTRAFAAALYAPHHFKTLAQKDPWWTLLAFYNSIRELGGAKTLFDADIRSRLKFLFNRAGAPSENRRHLRIVEELTSRLSQPEIVAMLEKLNVSLERDAGSCFDACLASNIIEVGVDIDRLSVMAVVGQPKTTSSYIQITGRVGRRWWDRPGLILTTYNPGKSRDRSHFEQFHSYHRRLYERVEPTTATPFALSAIKRAAAGVFLSWVRQHVVGIDKHQQIADEAREACDILIARCQSVLAENQEDLERSLGQLENEYADFERKIFANPQLWEDFPPKTDISYFMRWPGQYYTNGQKNSGFEIPTSMRQVDTTSELIIPDNPQ
jgi:superfamily II DNA/RNA helicase